MQGTSTAQQWLNLVMLIGVDASRAIRAQRTGTERYSLEIIRHLLALPAARAHDWRLYIPTPLAGDLWPTSSGVEVESCVLPGRRLWTHRALAREVTGRRPDVLFVPAHVIPYVRPRRRLPPCVVTIHDLGYLEYPDHHTWSQRRYLAWSTAWSVATATRAICVSQATADDLVAHLDTPPDKLDVIHEAPVQASAQSLPQETATTAPGAMPRPYALFLGTIQPRKNLRRVMDAFAQIHARVGWDLVLAGAPGWYSDELMAHARDLGLGDRLRFTGFVPDDAVESLMKHALFFCFPSLHEGFGLPVLEAQGLGVPVMTSNNSSLPEIAGDAALLVDPTDTDAIAQAMLRLADDAALRARLIAAGHENVKRFSWEQAAQETLSVLERAAAEGKQS